MHRGSEAATVVNLLIDIDSGLHTSLKHMAADRGMTLKDLVIHLLDPTRHTPTNRERSGMVHLLIDVDPNLHTKLKMMAQDREITLKDLVTSLLRHGVTAEPRATSAVQFRAFLEDIAS